MKIQNLLSKLKYFVMGIAVVCTLLFASNYAFSQEVKENKKEIVNPKREVFVVPDVTPANNNVDASKPKPKVKSMSPELLDDPWEEKLEKRDSTIEAESKMKNQENNAQEMKTNTKTEDNKEAIIKDNTLKEEPPKKNKTNNSTKKN